MGTPDESSRTRSLKVAGVAAVIVIVIVAASVIRASREEGSEPSPTSSPTAAAWICDNAGPPNLDMKLLRDQPWPMTVKPDRTYLADVTTSCGTMRMDLDAEAAPIAVNNFIHLARSGFYEGQVFHRIDRGLGIIQAGDPGCPTDSDSCGQNGPGYFIKDEWPNGLHPQIGTVAMASAGLRDSSGSQFIIVVTKAGKQLPKERTIFGTLVGRHSLQVARAILSIPTKENPAAVAAGVDAPSDFPADEFVYITKIKITERA